LDAVGWVLRRNVGSKNHAASIHKYLPINPVEVKANQIYDSGKMGS